MMRSRRGVSMLEALLAITLVGTVLAAVMFLFASTRKQAVGSEQRLNAAMLAQMVIERVKSELQQNPSYFRALGPDPSRFAFNGAVVERPGVALSPFFEHLIAKGTTPVYDAASKVSLTLDGTPDAEAKRLLDAYQDYQVSLTIEDDVDVETGAADSPLKELVKLIRVGVSRISMGDEASDPQAYRVCARVATPTESLTLPALDALYNNFEGASLAAMWSEFFMAAKDNPYFTKNYISLESKKLLADCYIVLGGTNTESFLTEGVTVSGTLVFTDGTPTLTIDKWIEMLGTADYYRHAAFKKARAQVQTYKATVIFEAMKRIGPVLDHMVSEHEKLLPKIDEVTALLQSSLDRLIQLNQQTLDAMSDYKKVEDKGKIALELAKLGEPKLREEADRLEREAGNLLRDIDRERDDRRRRQRQEAAAAKRKDAAQRIAIADQLKAGLTPAQIESEVLKEGNAPLGVMQSSNAAFAQFSSDRGRELSNILEMVIVFSFIHDFFASQNYRKIVDRLATYPARFRQTADEIQKTLTDHVNQTPDGPTPAEHAGACQALVEVEKIRQLEANAADPVALGKLTALGNAQTSFIRGLSKYLTASDVHDMEALSSRNSRFLLRLQKMKQLATKYQEIAQMYDAGGKIAHFLELYTQLSKELRLESDSIISKLQRETTAARGQLDAVANMTKEEILSAMKAVK